MLMLYCLVMYTENHEQEVLHKLRVCIKKIRALVRLTEKCSIKKDFLDILAPLKKVFDAAGEIRNLQIELALVQQHEGPGKKTEALQKKIDQQASVFCDGLDIHNLEKSYEKLTGIFKNIENDQLIHLYHQQQVKLEKIFAKKSEWHNGRKAIKRLLYIHDVLPKNLKKKLRLNLPYLQKLEEQLGQWHDLELHIQDKKTTGSKQSLKTVFTKSTRQLERLLTRFNHKVQLPAR